MVAFTSLGLEWVHEYDIKVIGIATGPNGETAGTSKLGTCEIDSNAIKSMPLHKFEEKRAIAVAALYLHQKVVGEHILPLPIFFRSLFPFF